MPADRYSDPLSTLGTGDAVETPATVIGRYHLLRKIGEGGMGEVWLAEARGTPQAKEAQSASGWDEVANQLPDFKLADLHGRTWTLADLNGKVTFVDVWATWCGPCQEELPRLQELYDKWKDRKDVSIITLDFDENPGLVAPFVEQKHFTFPVIPAYEYVRAYSRDEIGLPSNWIVDRQGIVRREASGYGGDSWMADAQKQISDVEQAKGDH